MFPVRIVCGLDGVATVDGPRNGVSGTEAGSGRAARGHPSARSYTPCPQWPYCEKRCSYCNFNKYIPRGVEEATLRSCLVTEAQTLLRLSGVRRWVLEAVN